MPAILGGGISGLAAAFYLINHRARPITIFETSKRVGGWIRSENHDGIVLERGPRTIRPQGPAGQNTLRLLQDLGLESKIKPILSTDSAAKNRMIYVNNELFKLPNDLKSAFKKLPPFSKSLAASLSGDLFKGRSRKRLDDESIYSFAERRFGKEVADYLISSMICGICAGDAKEISVKFLMREIFEREQKYGGVIRGMVLGRFSSPKKTPEVESELGKRAKEEKWSIYSLDGGLETLPKTMSKVLQENDVSINLMSQCGKVQFDDGQVLLDINGTEHKSDFLISSISSYRLSHLVKDQHPELAGELKSIPFVDVAVVNLQYDSADLLNIDGFGFLVPPSQNLPILGVIFDSCCFKTEGHTVLTVMMGGRWFKQNFGPDPTEQELLDIARRHIKKILKIKKPPTLSRVHILKKCIPQYVVGHYDRVARIRKYIAERQLPLGLCGSSYDGVGVNDVIISAKNVVNSIK